MNMLKMKDEKRISPEETKEMQHIILGILKAIDKVCREHNLQYFMIAGTMLGAVRHQGFIPWDDDADVALPRPDYEILLKHANEWLPKEYELVDYEKNCHYPYQFARIQDKRTTYILRRSFNFLGGIPVDVFPIDGITDNKLACKFHYMRYNFVNKLLYYSQRDPYKHGKGISCLFYKTLQKIFSPQKIHRVLTKIQSQYSYINSKLAADHDNRPERGILPKEVYGTPTPIMFEGVELMGVAQPDAYLSYCYGNYMELPNEIPPQNFRYMDMNLPYKNYKGSASMKKS